MCLEAQNEPIVSTQGESPTSTELPCHAAQLQQPRAGKKPLECVFNFYKWQHESGRKHKEDGRRTKKKKGREGR